MKYITLSFDKSIKRIFNKLVCKLLGHLYPFPRVDGSTYCFRCFEYLGETGYVYKYKVTAYNTKGETIGEI